MIHVEMIGVNGAGKTSLYRLSNAYLAKKLGYTPGPDKLWHQLVNDASLQPQPVRASRAFRVVQALDRGQKIMRRMPVPADHTLGLLSRAAMLRGDLLQLFLRRNASLAHATNIPQAYAHWELQYFLSMLTYHQMRMEEADRQVFLLDEGFVSSFTEPLLTKDGFDEELFAALMADIPLTLVLHVRADVERCLARLDQRSIPAPFAHLSRARLRETLERRIGDIEKVCERLRTTGTRVVEIANPDSLSAAFEELKPHLDALCSLALERTHPTSRANPVAA